MPTKESIIKYFETREAWRKWLETNFEVYGEKSQNGSESEVEVFISVK
ncbi:hypothetical protein [Capnocytophaga canimorsus]|nr:hypothetical protein [Capnocytophaga canimorsus]GIM57972.1 hypothetical protein CAPN007_01790 [Capnocytophaga canimorsus]